jgi:hypothetical protein
MQEAALSMLYNEKLLNILVTVVYRKTPLHQNQRVVRALELTDSWLKVVRQHKKQIPTSFDYHFFFKAVTCILTEDHSQSLQ